MGNVPRDHKTDTYFESGNFRFSLNRRESTQLPATNAKEMNKDDKNDQGMADEKKIHEAPCVTTDADSSMQSGGNLDSGMATNAKNCQLEEEVKNTKKDYRIHTFQPKSDSQSVLSTTCTKKDETTRPENKIQGKCMEKKSSLAQVSVPDAISCTSQGTAAGTYVNHQPAEIQAPVGSDVYHQYRGEPPLKRRNSVSTTIPLSMSMHPPGRRGSFTDAEVTVTLTEAQREDIKKMRKSRYRLKFLRAQAGFCLPLLILYFFILAGLNSRVGDLTWKKYLKYSADEYRPAQDVFLYLALGINAYTVFYLRSLSASKKFQSS